MTSVANDEEAEKGGSLIFFSFHQGPQVRRRVFSALAVGLIGLLSAQNLLQNLDPALIFQQMSRNTTVFHQSLPSNSHHTTTPASLRPNTREQKPMIAYAVSITDCKTKGRHSIIDGAAVLHQSIRLASRNSKYGYHMIAFLHPDADGCGPILKNLGYEVQIHETPVNESEIQNEDLKAVQVNSCCGLKEYLKLYSYLQFKYPLVIHLDCDCLILKPLDEVFDLMLNPQYNRNRLFSPSPAKTMWSTLETLPERVDFVFTRDYGMVEPGHRTPTQMGVQGGFLVVRPNQTDFDRNVELLRSGGDYLKGAGWGGEQKLYGGYYGSGTIQGLASYYYAEISKNRSVEMNRCYYNQMVDPPYGKPPRNSTCRTLEKSCQDCRTTPIEEIYSTHFTNCGKPFWCPNPAQWWDVSPAMAGGEHHALCMDLLREWHLVRRSLETEWKQKFSSFYPKYASPPDTNLTIGYYLNYSQGHCRAPREYIPMQFPGVFNETWIPKG